MPIKPREKRKQKTRQEIIDVTRKLIAEKGVDGISMRAIAKAIDYSPAGLYEYFDSKEDIICEVIAAGHHRMYDFLGQVDRSLSFPEYMRGIGEAYYRFAESNPDYFLLIFTHAPIGETLDDMNHDQSSFTHLLYGVQKGIDEGFLKVQPGVGLDEMALVFWSSVHGLAMLQLTQLKDSGMDFNHLQTILGMNTMKGLLS